MSKVIRAEVNGEKAQMEDFQIISLFNYVRKLP